MTAHLATESIVSAYLWLSVIVWTIAAARARRFRNSPNTVALLALFAVAAAACLAGRAVA